MGDYIFNNVTFVNTENESVAFELAHTVLGFTGDNPKKLLQFLKKLPIRVLVTQLKLFQNILDKEVSTIITVKEFISADMSTKWLLVF